MQGELERAMGDERYEEGSRSTEEIKMMLRCRNIIAATLDGADEG